MKQISQDRVNQLFKIIKGKYPIQTQVGQITEISTRFPFLLIFVVLTIASTSKIQLSLITIAWALSLITQRICEHTLKIRMFEISENDEKTTFYIIYKNDRKHTIIFTSIITLITTFYLYIICAV